MSGLVPAYSSASHKPMSPTHEDKESSAAIIYSGHWMISDVNGYESDDEASSTTSSTTKTTKSPPPSLPLSPNLISHPDVLPSDNLNDPSRYDSTDSLVRDVMMDIGGDTSYNDSTNVTTLGQTLGLRPVPTSQPDVTCFTYQQYHVITDPVTQNIGLIDPSHNFGRSGSQMPSYPGALDFGNESYCQQIMMSGEMSPSDSVRTLLPNCTLAPKLMTRSDRTDYGPIPSMAKRNHALTSASLSIDKNLSRLFKCMTLAYNEKPASPRWNWFRGLKLQLKDKLRLNNLIWRAWHMQFIFHVKPPVCQFDVSLDEDLPQIIILEGSYWKRRLDTVTAEYRKWRVTMKDRLFQNRSDDSPKRTFKLSHKLPNILKSAFYHQHHLPPNLRHHHVGHAPPMLATVTKPTRPAFHGQTKGGVDLGSYQAQVLGLPAYGLGQSVSAGSQDPYPSSPFDNNFPEPWGDGAYLNGSHYDNASYHFHDVKSPPDGTGLTCWSNAFNQGTDQLCAGAMTLDPSAFSGTFDDLYDDVLFSNLFGPPPPPLPLPPSLLPTPVPAHCGTPADRDIANVNLGGNTICYPETSVSAMNNSFSGFEEYFNIYGRTMGNAAGAERIGRSEALCVPFPDPKKLLLASSAARRNYTPPAAHNETSTRPLPLQGSDEDPLLLSGNGGDSTKGDNHGPYGGSEYPSTPVTKKSRVSYHDYGDLYETGFPSHLVQPGLAQLQPNVESYMGTLGSLEEILETTKRSYRHIYDHLQEQEVYPISTDNDEAARNNNNCGGSSTMGAEKNTSTLSLSALASYFTTHSTHDQADVPSDTTDHLINAAAPFQATASDDDKFFPSKVSSLDVIGLTHTPDPKDKSIQPKSRDLHLNKSTKRRSKSKPPLALKSNVPVVATVAPLIPTPHLALSSTAPHYPPNINSSLRPLPNPTPIFSAINPILDLPNPHGSSFSTLGDLLGNQRQTPQNSAPPYIICIIPANYVLPQLAPDNLQQPTPTTIIYSQKPPLTSGPVAEKALRHSNFPSRPRNRRQPTATKGVVRSDTFVTCTDPSPISSQIRPTPNVSTLSLLHGAQTPPIVTYPEFSALQSMGTLYFAQSLDESSDNDSGFAAQDISRSRLLPTQFIHGNGASSSTFLPFSHPDGRQNTLNYPHNLDFARPPPSDHILLPQITPTNDSCGPSFASQITSPPTNVLTFGVPSLQGTTSSINPASTVVSLKPYRKIAPAPRPPSLVAQTPWLSRPCFTVQAGTPPTPFSNFLQFSAPSVSVPGTIDPLRSPSFSSSCSASSASNFSGQSRNAGKYVRTIIRTGSISGGLLENKKALHDVSEKSLSDMDNMALRKRFGHLSAEHKRRFHIKNGFNSLSSSIPSLCHSPNNKTSKVAILSHAAVYIKHLRRKVSDTDTKLMSLRLQVASFNRQIGHYQITGTMDTGLTSNDRTNNFISADSGNTAHNFANFLKLDNQLCAQNYRTYVKGKCAMNWKYHLFSLITNPLFETYNEFVSTATLEEFCSTTLAWLDQFCLLPILRSIVTKLLVEISKKTSILVDPSKFSEEIVNLRQPTEFQPVVSTPVQNLYTIPIT